MWLEDDGPQPEISEVFNAVSRITGLPVRSMSGYVVLAITTGHDYKLTSNACCAQHATALLADATVTFLQQDVDGCLRAR